MKNPFLLCLVISLGSGWAHGSPTSVTILHTNDLHSHFRSEKTALGLGGIARIKTAADQIRKENERTFLVDGGDWSEGNIYFNEGYGVETLRMMERIGYDATVAGNHDWLNGPDHLLDVVQRAQVSTAVLGTNFDVSQYPKGEEFKKWIPPYVIKQKGAVKVALIGLSTTEGIYGRFVAPVRVTEIFDSTRTLAERLKKQADVVVVLSHNNLSTNLRVLREAPSVDLVVGAHDHVKLTSPLEVKDKKGKSRWVVEADSWGRYLGRVDLEIENGVVSPKKYKLIQMDFRVTEDPTILSEITSLEARVSKNYGGVFDDHIADTEIEFHRDGMSSPMGNLAADAYRNYTKADIALEVIEFVYGEIHRGEVHSVDVFNSNPAVINPLTGKSWTLKTIPVSGRMIKFVLNVMYSTKRLANFSLLNISGLSFKFDPLFSSFGRRTEVSNPDDSSFGDDYGFGNSFINSFVSPVETAAYPGDGLLDALIQPNIETQSFPMVKDIRINGEPIRSSQIYTLAMSGGLVYVLEFINQNILQLFPMDQMKDTGMESWRVIAQHMKALSPITLDKLQDRDRIRTARPDLGVSSDEIVWKPEGNFNSKGMKGNLSVVVRNHGATRSETGPELQLMFNKNGWDYGMEPTYGALEKSLPVPALDPGQSAELKWAVTLPMDSNYPNLYSVTAKLQGVDDEVNHTNDEATRVFKLTP